MNIQNPKAIISAPCPYCGARIGMPCVGDDPNCDERRTALAAFVKRVPSSRRPDYLGASWRRGGGVTKQARIYGVDKHATPEGELNTNGVNTPPDTGAPVIFSHRRRRP